MQIHYGKDQIQFVLEAHSIRLCIRVEDKTAMVCQRRNWTLYFRPFLRVFLQPVIDNSGGQMGLAIAEHAVRQHNGTLRSARVALGGLGW